MADKITAKNTPRPVHPTGQFAAKCVDIIDLGENVEENRQKHERYIAHKVALLFYTGQLNPDTGKPFEVKMEMAVSMSPKSNLRKMLESWRGKPYTSEQAQEGAPLDKLEGQWALLTISNETAIASGNLYAKVVTVAPLHPDIRKPELPTYKRDKFWAEQKEKYAAATAQFREANGGFNSPVPEGMEGDFDGLPPVPDSDLPFSPMVR